MIVQLKQAKTCLDIGTFTGMSAISMAEGGAIVHTIEVDPEVAKKA